MLKIQHIHHTSQTQALFETLKSVVQLSCNSCDRKASNTLGSLFKRKCFTTANSSPQIRVYRKKCQDCDSVYFGETGHVLSKRIGEHQNLNTIRANSRSALVSRKMRLYQELDLDSARIIFPSSSLQEKEYRFMSNFNLKMRNSQSMSRETQQKNFQIC